MQDGYAVADETFDFSRCGAKKVANEREILYVFVRLPENAVIAATVEQSP